MDNSIATIFLVYFLYTGVTVQNVYYTALMFQHREGHIATGKPKKIWETRKGSKRGENDRKRTTTTKKKQDR